MNAYSIADLLPGVQDFGIIRQKTDVLSGTYMGNNIVMTHLWSDHLFLASTNDMVTAPHLISVGINEPHNTRVLTSLVKPGDVFVDIGANVGYFSVLAGWRAAPDGEIWAFEPNPELVKTLSDNLFINGYKDMMRLHRIALSDKTGSAQMRIFPGYEATSSIREMSDDFIVHTANETGRESHLIDVELATLDGLMHGVAKIDVLKIDAEGHEPAIMRGAEAILRRSPDVKILMEFVPPIMGIDVTREHVKFLRNLGFSFNVIQFDGMIRPNVEDAELLASDFFDILLIKNL
jgi:FkbM family methyltransferase